MRPAVQLYCEKNFLGLRTERRIGVLGERPFICESAFDRPSTSTFNYSTFKYSSVPVCILYSTDLGVHSTCHRLRSGLKPAYLRSNACRACPSAADRRAASADSQGGQYESITTAVCTEMKLHLVALICTGLCGERQHQLTSAYLRAASMTSAHRYVLVSVLLPQRLCLLQPASPRPSITSA